MPTHLIDTQLHLNRLRARLRRLLDETYPSPVAHPARAAWTPAADITQTPDGLRVDMELPGLTRQQVEVTVHNHALTVTGERPSDEGSGNETYYVSERPVGKFSRSFTLGFEPRQVDATLKDGVLTITLKR